MATKSTSKCPAVIIIIAGLLMLSAIVAFFTFAVLTYLNPPDALTEDDTTAEETLEESEPEPELPAIYDLDLDKVAGTYNADTKFQTASIYKLFVVYEGYRRVQNGIWDGSEIAGWTRNTILKCLDLAIRESNSPCAETLWNKIGHEELNAIVQTDFGITTVTASSLMATPTEIMLMMKKFYEHPDITDEILVAQMKDSFLNQPVTTYNWRQGLPSGLSERVNVYNKVGWNWNGSYWTIYDDAAILDFVTEERHFIAVVMTSGISYQQIRQFGTNIEAAFYDQYVLKN